MALVKTIWIIHTTSRAKDSDTDAELTLFAVRPQHPDGSYVVAFPNLGYNERERGRTDEYVFDVSGKGIDETAKLQLRIGESKNGWRPSSIWAIGQTEEGHFVVMAHNPNWDPSLVFDNTAGQDSRVRPIN